MDIMSQGPIECAFTVYENFYHYYTGVYDKAAGPNVGGHAVTITGWTVMNNQKAWIIHNSWNTTWAGYKGKIIIFFITT